MTDAREYHEATKHSPRKLREMDFTLDPETQPRPYKRYEDLPREALRSVRPPQAPVLSVIAESRADPLAGTDQPAPGAPDRETLATLCHAASGVVRVGERDGEPIPFRAASCTGKLYHVDAYLITGDLPGLAAGVYHFDPRGFGLDVLRHGDYRGVLERATGGYAGVAEAPVTVVATSTWWRNAWKYRERTYRHAFWDSGTLLANLLAAADALDHRAEVVAGFADDPVVDLLGLDPDEEAPLELVPIGAGSQVPEAPTVDPIDPETVPYSPETVDYPLIPETWRASRLADGEAARDWRESVPAAVGTVPGGDGERVPLDPVDHETGSARPLYDAIRRRRSCRAFADRPLSRRKLGTVLDRATRGIPGDWNGGIAPGSRHTGNDPDGERGGDADQRGDGDADQRGDGTAGLQFNDVYVLATDVEGVPTGAYQFHPGEAALERVGDASRDDMTHLALGQGWAGDAHVNVYCTTDLDRVVDALGNRGYRLAQLEAGIVLGRLYLATYAHRELGGTGLTFFDDAVTEHLSPRAADGTPTTLYAFGVAE